MTTTAEAIRHAESNVTRLMRHGQNQWHFNTWSDYHRAWWQGHPQDYYQARLNRSCALVAAAANYLGYFDEDCCGMDYGQHGGDWRTYVRRLAAEKKAAA